LAAWLSLYTPSSKIHNPDLALLKTILDLLEEVERLRSELLFFVNNEITNTRSHGKETGLG